ncbi:hypothetical protein [Enterococcus sp. AZ163]|uniref:hypothetical protein n=1 Tax=Enterococcus sp. AZ163 TaxID=2774638 RepID=UPI003D2D1D33
MYNNEKLKSSFLRVLYLECVTIIIMLIAPLVIRNTNDEVKDSLGDPSGIGFGWGIIFGGWTLYLPIFLIGLGLLGLYIVSIVFRINYSKAYLNVPTDENRYMYLFVFSWMLYAFTSILSFGGFFDKTIFIASILLIIIDLCILYFCQLKCTSK